MTTPSPSHAFRDLVELALKHYTSTSWLGEKSPLAAPYLLGKQLQGNDDSPEARGRILQKVMKQAASRLVGKQSKRRQDILEEYYFEDRSEIEVYTKLGLPKSTFHEARKMAITDLADALIEELQPALLLESPPQPAPDYCGRTRLAQECLAALRSKQMTLISGSGGMGKTTLASQIAHEWGVQRVFWFTVRPGLNDHLNAFLLYWSYFLHQQGASALFQQMIASLGALDLKLVPGLTRAVLEQTRDSALLLCIDEVDLLQPADSGEHTQFLAFVESLRGLTPILLVGQRAAIQVDHPLLLIGVELSVLEKWLLRHRIRLSAEEQDQLHRYTRGVPHLIDLFITLHQIDEPLSALLQKMATTPSVESLLARILSRLKESEREVLMELAVMQGVAPADAWRHGRMGALRMLMERHLVQGNEYGGVWLLPAYRQFIVASLPAERLADLHTRAAHLFASRGQYTTAAYHYSCSSQPEYAIHLWDEHRGAEIDQGQAHAALRVFRPMLAHSYAPPIMQRLTEMCARLEHLTGDRQQARKDLDSISWTIPVLSVQADELAGVIANDQRDFSAAQAYFHRALTIAGQLVETHMAQAHKGLGWMHLMKTELDRAWQEAQRATYEAENLKGFIQEEYRAYQRAEQHYLAALELAHETNHAQGIAKTSSNLAGLYAILGQSEKALDHWRTADQLYRRVEKVTAVAGNLSLLCFIHNLGGDHQAALQAAQETIRYLTERGLETPGGLRNILDQSMAEAYLGLGDLTAAMRYVRAALDSGDARVFVDATRTLAEVHLQQGDLENALVHTTNAIQSAQQNADPFQEAYAWRVAARTYNARQEFDLARRASTKAITIFTELGLPHEVEKIHSNGEVQLWS